MDCAAALIINLDHAYMAHLRTPFDSFCLECWTRLCFVLVAGCRSLSGRFSPSAQNRRGEERKNKSRDETCRKSEYRYVGDVGVDPVMDGHGERAVDSEQMIARRERQTLTTLLLFCCVRLSFLNRDLPLETHTHTHTSAKNPPAVAPATLHALTAIDRIIDRTILSVASLTPQVTRQEPHGQTARGVPRTKAKRSQALRLQSHAYRAKAHVLSAGYPLLL